MSKEFNPLRGSDLVEFNLFGIGSPVGINFVLNLLINVEITVSTLMFLTMTTLFLTIGFMKEEVVTLVFTRFKWMGLASFADRTLMMT